MSVHYKFKSALSFDTITFDGLHISIRDLKKSILQQKQIGKGSDFDLQITNAQSNEVYEDDNTLVPKNSSLIVVRIPLTSQQKKAWEKSENLQTLGSKATGELDPHVNKLAKTVDLANVDASEGDKIQAAITQSTLDYDPSNYLRIKGSNQVGEIPAYYRCFKCNQPGHWIKDCKLTAPPETNNAVDIKKSTGIPQSFMVPVAGPGVPGAMMTPTGTYAVPSIEHEARKEPMRKVHDPVPVEKPSIPDDLICGVCKDLLVDAVLIPCCGNSFCDECIRNVLLESEDHQCPDCREKDVSPDTLIPNRFLRNSVTNFRSQTGYCRTAPSFLQSKMAAQAEAQAAHPVEIHHGGHQAHEPAPVLSSSHSQPPARRNSPIRHAKDNGPSHRPERVSPDEVHVIDDASRPPVPGTVPALGSDNGSRHVPSIDSVGQPIYNIGTTPHNKPYHDNIDYHKGHYSRSDYHRKNDYEKSDYHKSDSYSKRLPYKSHFIRHDRSDTPTVDERSASVEPVLYPFESIPPHPQPPRMMPPGVPPGPPGPPGVVPPPMMYPQGNFPVFRPSYPHAHPPPRLDMAPFPPGVDHMPPRMGMHYRGSNNYYPPRAPFRPMHPPNGPHTSGGTIDDPVEAFQRLLDEKDRGKGRSRGPRRRSRSYSRSFSRSISPRLRSRPPRSRSRSRSPSRVPPPRSRSPRSPRSPPPRSRSRSIRRRSRSRSFTISRSRSPPPRSPRSYHSRSPPSPIRDRDRDRRFASPPRRRDDRRPSPPPRNSPIRYYSRGYKEEYGGPPPKDRERDREPRPIERIDRDRDRDRERDTRPRSRDRVDRDRDRDRVRRFPKPTSVVQQEFYSSSTQDFNRFVRCPGPMGFPRFPKDGFVRRFFPMGRRKKHQGDRYESKEGSRYTGSRERDRDFDKDRERDRDRVGYKRERLIPSLLETPTVPPSRYEPNFETRERIARDWEKTRDRELELQERERERQAAALAPPGEYVEKLPSKKRAPSRGRPVEAISCLPRKPSPIVEPERGPNVTVLTYVTPKESPLKEVSTATTKSPDKEKKAKEKKKKKKEESDKKEKKKKKKVKEKSDKKESSEPGDVTSNTAEDPEEETKISEDVPEREDPLYGDLAVGSDIVDSTVVETYTKPEEVKEEVKDKDVVLAPLPELSKWEKDDEPLSQSEERIQENGSVNKQVTSEVLKRAENAIFKKSVNPIPEKKSERKPEVKKPTKEGENAEVKEEKVDKVKEEKVEVVEKPKEKEIVKIPEREPSPRRERTEKRDDRERKERDRERRDERDRDRYRERRDQEREREHKVRVLEREKERQITIAKEIERERYLSSKEYDRGRSSDRKIETIPLRISAKERLGAKVEEKGDIKKRLEKREVKAEKPKRKEEVKEEKKKEEERLPGDVVVVNQVTTGEVPVGKKRSVSLDTERVVKKIKVVQGENESSADSSASSEESVSVKKHKKKKKKKHKKKKKKRKHSSSDSDSSSSSSDSEHEKKRKHKKSKKAKKRKKSKK